MNYGYELGVIFLVMWALWFLYERKAWGVQAGGMEEMKKRREAGRLAYQLAKGNCPDCGGREVHESGDVGSVQCKNCGSRFHIGPGTLGPCERIEDKGTAQAMVQGTEDATLGMIDEHGRIRSLEERNALIPVYCGLCGSGCPNQATCSSNQVQAYGTPLTLDKPNFITADLGEIERKLAATDQLGRDTILADHLAKAAAFGERYGPTVTPEDLDKIPESLKAFKATANQRAAGLATLYGMKPDRLFQKLQEAGRASNEAREEKASFLDKVERESRSIFARAFPEHTPSIFHRFIESLRHGRRTSVHGTVTGRLSSGKRPVRTSPRWLPGCTDCHGDGEHSEDCPHFGKRSKVTGSPDKGSPASGSSASGSSSQQGGGLQTGFPDEYWALRALTSAPPYAEGDYTHRLVWEPGHREAQGPLELRRLKDGSGPVEWRYQPLSMEENREAVARGERDQELWSPDAVPAEISRMFPEGARSDAFRPYEGQGGNSMRSQETLDINGPLTPNEWRVLNLLDCYGSWYGEGGFGFEEPDSNNTFEALQTLKQRGFVMSEFIDLPRIGYKRTKTALRYGLVRERISEWKAQLPPLPESETRSQSAFALWWYASKLQDEAKNGGVDKQLASAIFRAGRLSTFQIPLEPSQTVEA